jgi:SsrA-binding protein
MATKKRPGDGKAHTGSGDKVVASNRRARRDYDILDTYECGMVLTGSEVKSLRGANVQMNEGFARVERNEMWLLNVTISQWLHSSAHTGHVPDRRRKLLMHRSEINRIRARVDQERLSLVPMSIYFKDGRAKIEIALAKGRRLYDKRHALAKRESDLEAQRAMRRHSR